MMRRSASGAAVMPSARPCTQRAEHELVPAGDDRGRRILQREQLPGCTRAVVDGERALEDAVGLGEASLGVAGLERSAAFLDGAHLLAVDQRDVAVPEVEQV